MADATPQQQTGAPPLLELRGISKSFPGTLANDSIDLTLKRGEIHALLGENGAGKSTLVKIIYGLLTPDAGTIAWHGKALRIAGPAVARRLGIGMVFQHFSLFESMTVLENIALAMPPGLGMQALRTRVAEFAAAYGLSLDPDRHVFDLSVGERQRIEILRCLLLQPELLILDEPTSVLTPQEAERLFETLRRLAEDGKAVLYISHKLAEVQALCHRATILRDGRVVHECDPAQETARSLAELMIGERLGPPVRRGVAPGTARRLEVEDLTLQPQSPYDVPLRGISFHVRVGEVLAIAGVAGNGQRALMRALAGETVLPGVPGAIRIDGHEVAHLGPTPRRALGAAFVPEQRLGEAAVGDLSLADNTLLTAWRRMALVRASLVRRRRTRAFARDIIERFAVRATGVDADARSLSGGNLQKFIVGREVLQAPRLLVVAQPTWGVDAGAAAAIHQAMLALAAEGTAVLAISQDLDEVLAIADRVAVISEGRLSVPRPAAELTVDEIGLLMGGVHGEWEPAAAHPAHGGAR